MAKDLPAFDWQQLSKKYVIGVDEVGRGCLAGPVYAAAVCLKDRSDYPDIVDSKTTTLKKRKILSDLIQKDHQVCIAWSSVEEIETYNILKASLLAMKRAILGLKLNLQDSHVLVDGKFIVPGLEPSVKQTALIKGDSRATPIAAASIVAKVARDELLIDLAKEFPQYGLEKHKGYCTKAHKEAIAKFGPAHFHRKTFKGVKEYL